MDFDIQLSLSAAFSYSERYMARKLQRHLVQVQINVPRQGGSYFMKYGNADLQYITLENSDRLNVLKDFIVLGSKITFFPAPKDRVVTIQYNAGFSIQRGKDQVPADIIVGILMYAGALIQTKTDVTTESLKRSAICSENLFSPYRLKPKA